jgi:hypothetical protein
MKINKTTAAIINDVLLHLQESYNYKAGYEQYFVDNLEDVSGLFQQIGDFDLEGMIDVALYTRWLSSDDNDFDNYLTCYKDFIFHVTGLAFHEYNGDVVPAISQVLKHAFNPKEQGEDLIDDSVYGDVDPEDISFLNKCLRV